MNARCRMNPLEAMQLGKSFVKAGRLEEGILMLGYAKEEFLQGIGKAKEAPRLYQLVNDCYLLMMSATFSYNLGMNIELTMERQRFNEYMEKRIKRILPQDEGF